MAKGFYAKLATQNLTRNRRMYGPYAVAAALMSGMVFIIQNLVFSESITNVTIGGTVKIMFNIGTVVMVMFTIGYMLYINSFLIKRRKKEFGLYGVLGMKRRHVARVILWENTLLSGGSLLLGYAAGAVFGRLMFMLLMNMLDTAQGSAYVLSGKAAVVTALIFGVIFIFSTLYNLNQVRLASPVDLLKGERMGEKKARFVAPVTVIGTGCLAFAYYMAITVKNPSIALMNFWPAVILVILATWLLFTGGSVFVLGALKRNKKLYYRPGNFVAISGLAHRMKQNAAGLANICILSTMVMVTVACCYSLYAGKEEILVGQNPNDIQYTVRINGDEALSASIIEDTKARAEALAPLRGVTVDEAIAYRYIQQTLRLSGGSVAYEGYTVGLDADLNDFYGVYTVPLADYLALVPDGPVPGAGEVVVLTNDAVEGLAAFPVEGGALAVKAIVRDTPFTLGKNAAFEGRLCVVSPDEETALRLARAIDPDITSLAYLHSLSINITGAEEDCLRYAEALESDYWDLASRAREYTNNGGAVNRRNIFTNRLEGYALYGGLLFLGVFFAALFLTNTVLIIYFKQISEGFDDRERFEILQKVGLSDQEVRGTVNKQMLIVFLLPLLFALLHILAATNMIQYMLGTFMLTNFGLTQLCIAVTCAVFIVVYLCVYRLTARTYYRLVKW